MVDKQILFLAIVFGTTHFKETCLGGSGPAVRFRRFLPVFRCVHGWVSELNPPAFNF